MKTENTWPVCLTIAGLDPSGGAGIIADIKTFSAFECFATAAVASLTFQNTIGVFGADHQSAATVRRQVEPILKDLEVAALKTGMLPTREVIEEVARIVTEYQLRNFVVDPVVRSTSGFDLIDDEALKVLIEKLFPLAAVITPNLPEAERIAGMKIENVDDIRRAASRMQSFGARAVLIKGGHKPIEELGSGLADFKTAQPDTRSTATDSHAQAENQGKTKKQILAVDFLFADGAELTFAAEYIDTTATHGTGCTFAAAIAAGLAHGRGLHDAIEAAKRFVTAAIRTAPAIGHGHSPVNHLVRDF